MNIRHTSQRRRQEGSSPLRWLLPFLLFPVVCLAQQETQSPAPIERRPPTAAARYETNAPRSSSPQAGSSQRKAVSPLPRGEHLAQWMTQHSDLTPQQQQQALGREPGFGNLPSDTQQRFRDRLAQLDALNPQKRERFLARTEVMERLTPAQRAEVRGAMGQLGALPVDQRRVVARTFRSLRDLPADQRLDALNSGRYGPGLDSRQRAVIFGLLRVEPMLPSPTHPQAVPVNPVNPGSQTGPGTQPEYPMPR